MEKNTGSTQNLFGYFVTAFASCKTILRWHRRAPVLALSLTFALSACNQKTENHTHNPPPDYTGSNMGGGNGGGSVTGTGDGGGGQGIACTDKVKDPRFRGKVMVRDIYEAIRNHNRTMKTIPNDVSGTDTVSAEAIKVLVDSLKHFYGPASANLEFVNEKFWFDFVKKISFLDDDYKLHPSQDANSPIALPDECKIVQIAFWDESAGSEFNETLYVNAHFWKLLDQTDKIALLAHEFFFKQARKSDYKNSDLVRFKVGQLMSVDGIDPIFKSWVSSKSKYSNGVLPVEKSGFKYCKGYSSEDPVAKADLYQYSGSDGLQHVVVLNVESQTLSLSVLNNIHFQFNPHENKFLSVGMDLVGIAHKFKSRFVGDFVMNDEQKLFSIFLDGSGLFDHLFQRDGRKSEFNELLVDNIEMMSIDDIEIWNGSVESSHGMLKVGISNPAIAYKAPSRKLLPKKQLLKNLNLLIESKLFLCGQVIPDQVGRVISILKAEVAEMVNRPEYPNNFIKWKKALQQLEENYSKVAGKAGCTPMKDLTLLESIPRLAYSLKADSYDESKVDSLIGELEGVDKGIFVGFVTESNLKLDTGALNIQHGSVKSSISLKCDSGHEIYWKLVNENLFFSESNLSSKEMTMKVVTVSDPIKLDGNIFSSPLVPNEQGRMLLVKTLLSRFGSDISSGKFRSDYLNKLGDNRCARGFFPMSECSEIKDLFADISSSQSISIKPCEDRNGTTKGFTFFKDGSGEFMRGCGTLYTNFSKQRYDIKFQYTVNFEEISEINYASYSDQEVLRLFEGQRLDFINMRRVEE